MKAPSILTCTLFVFMATLPGCVGGDQMFPKNISGNSSSDTGKLGAINMTIGGKPGQFVMSDMPGKEFYKVIATKGSSEDTGGGAPLDLWAPTARASGSILGFRLNQAMKITVASKDFRPRVVVLETLTVSPYASKREYFQASSSDVVADAGGMNVVVVTYRAPEDKNREGQKTFGAIIGVLSADGKAGEYTIKTEFVN